MTTDQPRGPGHTELVCGARFAPTTGGALTLTCDFPPVVDARGQVVGVSVAVLADGPRAHGVTTAQAEVFLVREGRTVTLPAPQDSVGQVLDLAAGRTARMPAVATLVPCSGGVLGPGTYDLYVRVVLNLEDGTPSDSFGGPWPMVVR